MDKKFVQYLYNKMENKKVVIWGTGKFSIHGEGLLKALGITNYNYIDNDKQKQKNGYKGREVISIEDVTDNYYVIVSVMKSDTMMDDLKKRGLNEIENYLCVAKYDLYFYLYKEYGADTGNELGRIYVERFGNEYGGFWVDCEGFEDKKPLVVYSFGIGEDLSFSQALSDRYAQSEIYAFDPTPKAIKYVERYDKNRFRKFKFYELGLSNKNGQSTFYLPIDTELYVSGSEICNFSTNPNNSVVVEMRTLKYITDMLGTMHIDLLKMDIEGSEFLVIPQILSEDIEIEQICVEFHDRLVENGLEKRKEVLELLYLHNYRLINVTFNGQELTFVKRKTEIGSVKE